MRTRIKKQEKAEEVPLSKFQQRKLDKQLARVYAFYNRFNPPFYVKVEKLREVISGLIEDHDKDPAYLVHHKINYGGIGLIRYNERKELN